MKIIDLSLPTEESPSERFGVKMTSLSHDEGVGFFCSLLGCSKYDFPGGRAGAGETVSLNSHSGTHIDAPWHYAPTSEGRRARMIDEMPPEWFFNDGVVLDMRHKPAGSAVTVGDIEACLDKMAYTLKPFDIILLQTGADKYWGKADYADKGCGLLRESTFWLLDRGAKVIGTDAWGLDRPFWAIKDEFGRTGEKRDPLGGSLRRHRKGILPDREARQSRPPPGPHRF